MNLALLVLAGFEVRLLEDRTIGDGYGSSGSDYEGWGAGYGNGYGQGDGSGWGGHGRGSGHGSAYAEPKEIYEVLR